MLDIKLIREKPEMIRKDLKKRRDAEKLSWLEDLIQKDKEYLQTLQKAEELRARRNKATEEIRELKKQGKGISQKVSEIKGLGNIQEQESRLNELLEKIHWYLLRLPNLMHPSVPYGKDESGNVQVRKWGRQKKPAFELIPHGELAEKLGGADFEAAAQASGRGFYYLKGHLALLNRALINLAITHLVKKGFTFIEPPLLINKKVVEGVTDYEFFENMIYKIENEDLHLIGTSEHPLMGMFMNTTVKEEDLPLKLVSYSPCFRKEIGSHGIDERGFFRVHQFHKVEQVVLCTPQQSEKLHEEITKNAEELMKILKLPYRIVNICTGDLGIVASKKYDLELWMPRQKKYKEAGSSSNCTDYQARRLNIRYGIPGAPKNPLVHSLNNTAIATSRVIIAILENYQKKDGSVEVPAALQPYMGRIKTLK